MDEKRKGEIALLLVKYYAAKEGIKISKNLQREIGDIAKQIGISPQELAEFAKPIILEVVERNLKTSIPA